MGNAPIDRHGSETGPSSRATETTYEIDEKERPSEAVVRTVAAHTNTSVIELDPLYDVIDPDHLDGLFGDSRRRTVHGERSVTFGFNGCEVSLTEDVVVVRGNERDSGDQ